MLKKRLGERTPIGECRPVYADICLVELLVHVAIAVYADLAPFHGTRHVEIGRDIDALLDALRDEIVEAVDGIILTQRRRGRRGIFVLLCVLCG